MYALATADRRTIDAPLISTPSNLLYLIGCHFYPDEPSIYILGKFGIRIEDMVAVTPNGPRRFDRSTHELVVG